MKKKLLLLGLMVALSTVGYGAMTIHPILDPTIGDGTVADHIVKENIDKINSNFKDVSLELMDQIIKQEETEALDKEQNGRLDGLEGQMSEALGNISGIEWDNKQQQEQLDKHEEALANKADKGEINDLYSKVEAVEGENNRVNAEQNDQIAANKEVADRADRVNKVQNQQIGNLQSQNIEQNNRLDKVEKENDKQNAAIDKNKQDIAANKTAIDKEIADRAEADNKLQQQIDKFQGQMGNYGARLDNLENKVDNLDEKFNKGLSLMAAMNAVDFQNVSEGEMAIGAGFGHYGNAQSVAVGVAYAPTQNLNLNVKYSVTAGDLDSFAIGAGASYKFRVK